MILDLLQPYFSLLTPCDTRLHSLRVRPVWPALLLILVNALFMDQLFLSHSLNLLVSGAILAFFF